MAETSPTVVASSHNENPEPLFSKESAENVTIKEGRTIRKAKRFNSITNTNGGSQFEENGGGDTDNVGVGSHTNGTHRVTTGFGTGSGKIPYGKNSKKSRTGTRGQPKKGT